MITPKLKLNIIFILALAFLSGCVKNRPGVVADKYHVEEYTTHENRCIPVNKIPVCSSYTNVHPARWVLVLKSCDEHGDCDYWEIEVSEEDYNVAEDGGGWPEK